MQCAFLRSLITPALLLAVALLLAATARAQPNPRAVVRMRTDTTSAGPTVNIFVSVVDQAKGQTTVAGLPSIAFTLAEEEKATEAGVCHQHACVLRAPSDSWSI